MKDLKSRFLNQENFYLAFKKLSHYYNQSNEWFDLIELSDYEANLETNLSRLISELTEGSYKPKEIEPIPFPKKNDKNDKHRIRPYFKIAVEDQLVWIAIVNVIGKFLEKKMPFWSYGNRLFQPIWYEQDENGEVKIKKGDFINSSANFYKQWNQSWPQYRRNISLTVKVMANGSNFKEEDLDEEISKEIYRNEAADDFSNNWYLNKDNWSKKKTNKLYWTGLDFEKFFPSINTKFVIQNIKKHIVRDNGKERDDTDLLFNLIEKMLNLSVKSNNWFENELNTKNTNFYTGIPTGLLVSGFLANVAMIEVDNKLNSYIKKAKGIALLKFVDDQVVLSKTKKKLIKFLNYYNQLIIESEIGVCFQHEKTIPENTIVYENKKFSFEKSNKRFKYPIIDVQFPQPFMTFALKKMSNLNDEDLDLMDAEEIDKHESDLIHFMLTDFPDSEMKKETRMAFASFKLCQLAKNIKPNFHKIDSTTDTNYQLAKELVNNEELSEVREKNKNKALKEEIKLIEKKFTKLFSLLMKSITENPDKLKLWKRCVEFCFNTGYDGFKIIFDELKRLNIHKKSKSYIAAYIYQQINLKSFFALNIVSNPTSGYWEGYTSFLHLKNASKFYLNRKDQFLELKCFEISLSQGKLFHSLLEINSLNNSVNLRNNLINKYQGLINDSKLKEFSVFTLGNSFVNEQKEIESFIWYYINKLSKINSLKLWKESINFINTDNKIFWSILSFYPKDIPKDVLKKIQKTPDKVNNREQLIYENSEFRNRFNGIIYEIFKNSVDDKKDLLKYYPEIKRRLDYENKDYISLDDYLQKLLELNTNKTKVDIRLSEWSLLEILRQVTKVLDIPLSEFSIFNDENKNTCKIHPANYLVPEIWLDYNINTWGSWKKIVAQNSIKLINDELLIDDYRFFPINKLWKQSEISWFFGMGSFSVIIGLSSLFVKLLSNSFEWPAATNKLLFIDKVYNNVLKILNETNVSTNTRQVITKIFSKKDVDYFGNREFSNVLDSTSINNLNDFKLVIEKLQKELENKRFSVYDGKPRQLTVIDIDVLNEIKSII
jgi:hypothetical protein